MSEKFLNGARTAELWEAMKSYVDERTGSDAAQGGEVYSTEEIRIGTWIDGKPVYKKYLLLKMPNTVSKYDTTTSRIYQKLGSLSIDTLVGCSGTVQQKTGDYAGTMAPIYGSFRSSSDAERPLGMYLESNYIYVQNSFVQFFNADVIIRLEYTKTTDQATIPLNDRPLQALAAAQKQAAMPAEMDYNEEV